MQYVRFVCGLWLFLLLHLVLLLLVLLLVVPVQVPVPAASGGVLLLSAARGPSVPQAGAATRCGTVGAAGSAAAVCQAP